MHSRTVTMVLDVGLTDLDGRDLADLITDALDAVGLFAHSVEVK